MDLLEKLQILADSAKYDVACTSSGASRGPRPGMVGTASPAGCCHSFTPDGRCVTLLKVLMTNSCCYDCAYCACRRTNEIKRATFTPRELADLTISFYRRNYIEGLFLSSAVIKDPNYTTELMVRCLRILREDLHFNGYIHAKAIPGTDSELLEELGRLTDRVSVNLELPSQKSLAHLAPEKTKHGILTPMRQICDRIQEDAEYRAITRRKTTYLAVAPQAKKERQFAPAGQSTQIIVGASPESDYQILTLSAALYARMALKRVFFSAYLPVNDDARLPQTTKVPLDREHRLYQADWLMRFYGFGPHEIIDKNHPFLDLQVDPKANWALNNLDLFPVEINTAPYEMLLRVPGIGPRGARYIIRARKTAVLDEAGLVKLGIAYKRARYFITCNGRYQARGIDFSPDYLRAQLASPIDGGKHGRRSRGVLPNQLSLFESDADPLSLVSQKES